VVKIGAHKEVFGQVEPGATKRPALTEQAEQTLDLGPEFGDEEDFGYHGWALIRSLRHCSMDASWIWPVYTKNYSYVALVER
jgi:hypothetical protein